MIFYFLWGDPLFCPELYDEACFFNERLIKLRREMVLGLLDMIYEYMAWQENQSEKRASFFKEMKEQVNIQLWEIGQLRQHVSPEIRKQILIDKEVNKLDPDFSFERAVKTGKQ